MKTLTLWQPWASLMAFEEKKVETREWATNHRGLLAIHAARKTPEYRLGQSRLTPEFIACFERCAKKHKWATGFWTGGVITVGHVLCIVKLVGIEPVENVRDELSAQERIFGNYSIGRYAWFTEMVERFDVPIPAKGNRMLWNWERAAL